MKKKIIIFSAGSAGREVFQLISIINKLNKKWEVVGYVDSDPKKVGKTIDGVKVFSVENKPKHKEIFATCGIMNPIPRKIKIIYYISLYYFNFFISKKIFFYYHL